MVYKSQPVGNEISCTMYGIEESILNNNKFLKEILINALKEEKFTILKEISHDFEPQGYTILIMLAESHASIHTYPEYNSLHFYIYSCRSPEDGGKTLEILKEKLNPISTDIHERKVIVDGEYRND